MRILKEIIDRLIQEWPESTQIERPDKLRCMIINKKYRSVVYIFSNKHAFPLAFAKITSASNDYSLFHNEYKMLRFIQETSNDIIAPTPFFETRIDGTTSLVTSAINGQNLFSRGITIFNPFMIRKEQEIIGRVINLWKVIHSDQRFRSLLKKEYLIEYIDKIEKYFLMSFPTDKRIFVEIDSIRHRIEKIGPMKTWLAPVHGDFWKGNLIEKDHKIYAVDWERGKTIGFPIFDIFMFCSSYNPNHDAKRSFIDTYLKKNRVNAAIKNIFHMASNYLDIDNDLLMILFELYLLDMCTKGIQYFNSKTKYDNQWKNNLDIFIDNKLLIAENMKINTNICSVI